MQSNFRRIVLLRGIKLFDLAVVTLTFVAAFAIANDTFNWPKFTEVLTLRIKVVNFFIFGGYLIFCSLVFSACGFYRSHRMSLWTRWNREILLATILITGVLLVLPLRMAFATKYFYLVFWLLTAAFLTLSRIVTQHLLYYLRSRGRNLRNIVIVGEGKDATALAERIEKENTLGYCVVRIINAKEA
jgi:FlaA1/EpsC-like NDP-sugar epimerase